MKNNYQIFTKKIIWNYMTKRYNNLLKCKRYNKDFLKICLIFLLLMNIIRFLKKFFLSFIISVLYIVIINIVLSFYLIQIFKKNVIKFIIYKNILKWNHFVVIYIIYQLNFYCIKWFIKLQKKYFHIFEII